MKNTVWCLAAVFAAALLFSSCEAFIHTQGSVYDKSTGQPVSGVAVQLLWRHNRDTMTRAGFLADTVSYSARIRLRKSGVKDDFSDYDAESNRWGRRVPLLTDSAGKFRTLTFLVGAVFGIPKVSLLLVKDGYRTTLVADKDRPGAVFYLERAAR